MCTGQTEENSDILGQFKFPSSGDFHLNGLFHLSPWHTWWGVVKTGEQEVRIWTCISVEHISIWEYTNQYCRDQSLVCWIRKTRKTTKNCFGFLPVQLHYFYLWWNAFILQSCFASLARLSFKVVSSRTPTRERGIMFFGRGWSWGRTHTHTQKNSSVM